MQIKCTCGGYNENCYRCYGSGWYDDKQKNATYSLPKNCTAIGSQNAKSIPNKISLNKPDESIDNVVDGQFVECEICKLMVIRSRYDEHFSRCMETKKYKIKAMKQNMVYIESNSTEIDNIKEYKLAEHSFVKWLRKQDLSAQTAKDAALHMMKELKQFATKGKVHALETWLEDRIKSDKKTIVTFIHRKPLETIYDKFSDLCQINGQISSKGNENKRIFLLNTRAGVSRTLIQADTVMMFEMPWTAGDWRQYEYSCRCITNIREINVISLIAKQTIEERLAAIVYDKRRSLGHTIEDFARNQALFLLDLLYSYADEQHKVKITCPYCGSVILSQNFSEHYNKLHLKRSDHINASNVLDVFLNKNFEDATNSLNRDERKLLWLIKEKQSEKSAVNERHVAMPAKSSSKLSLDAAKEYKIFRENGRFGSHPSFDKMDDD